MASLWADKKQWRTKREKAPRLEELLGLHKFENGKFYKMRLIGDPHIFFEHWIKVKKNDGGIAKVRKLCIDPESAQANNHDESKCPYCTLLRNKPRMVVLQNMIDRQLQKNEPRTRAEPTKAERKSGLKSKSSETWTPVVVGRLPGTVARKINDYTSNNTRPSKKTGELVAYGPEHPKFGFDLTMKWEDGVEPANQYMVDRDKKTKLTEDEAEYLVWDLKVEKLEDVEAATKEAKSMGSRLIREVKNEKTGKYEDQFDPIGGSAKGKGSDDDGMSDLDADDFRDDSDLSVVRDKKKAKSDDIDVDDFDDDEPKKSKKKKKAKHRDDDDDDDDRPKKKKKKDKGKKKVKLGGKKKNREERDSLSF